MSEQQDSTGSTQMFQAFVEKGEPTRSGPRPVRLVLLAAGLAGVVVAGALVWVALAG